MSQYARYSGLGSGGGGGGGGVTTVGALDSQTPSSNGLVIVGTTIYAQSASTTAPGLVNNTTQSFSGNKTFTGTISASNLSGTNTGDVTIGTANGLSLVAQVLSLGLSSTSTTGALSSTDWNTFNNKQTAGAYITALTGDVSATGPGSVPATINSVGGSTAASIHTAAIAVANSTSAASPNTLVLRDGSSNFSAGTITASLIGAASLNVLTTAVGAPNGVASLDGSGKVPASELPSTLLQYQGSWNPNTNTPMLADGTGTNGFTYRVSVADPGTVPGLNDPSMTNFQVGDLVIYSSTAAAWQLTTSATGVVSVNGAQGAVTVNAINQLTGDITAGPASQSQSEAATITLNAVTNAKLAQAPSFTVKGNNTGSTANVSDLTVSQVNTLLGSYVNPLTTAGDIPYENATPATTRLPIGTTGQLLTVVGGLPAWSSPATGGTVTSVAFADSTGTFSVTGSPVTSTGTLTLSAFNSQAQATFLAAPAGSSGVPSFRTIVASDIPTLNQNTTGTASNVTGTVLIAHGGTGQTTAAAAFNALTPMTTTGDLEYESATNVASRLPIGSSGQVLTVSGGIPAWASPATSGTVTSVAFADGSTTPIYTISGSPVTSSGTITETLATQVLNTVFAGPTSGSPAQPTFRSLIPADLPTGNLTDAGTDGITITNGTSAVIGTGTSISQHVADTTHNGYLSSTDWNTFNSKQAAGNYITALTGDVTASGPGSAAATLATVNGNVGSFGSSTSIPSFTVNAKGLITAASGNAVVAPAGTLSGTTLNATVVNSSLTSVGTITSGTWNGTTIAIANGGTGQTNAAAAFAALSPLTTVGDIIYENATPAPARLPIGTTGQVLTVSGGLPSWSSPATSGTVTSVAFSDGSSTPIYTVTGSPITSSGTITETLVNQNANTVFAGPSSGSPGQPTFRGLVSSDIPSLSAIYLPLTGGTMSGAISMGSNQIHTVTDPTSPQDAATKNYVDSVASGLQPIQAVYAATIGSNISGTYNNGVGGIGATFTTTSTATFTLDGTTPPLNSRILFKDQASGFQNGVYNFTVAPVTSVSGAIFTRSLDYDTASDVNAGNLIPVLNGTVNGDSSWLQTATVTTVGTDSLIFVLWTANPTNYLLKANDLSDVGNLSTSFNNISPLTTLGDIIYENATPSATRLPGNTTSTKNFLTQTGTGSISAPPSWGTILGADVPLFTTSLQGTVPHSPGGTANFLRSDGTWAPATGSGGVAGVVFSAYLSTNSSFTANTPIKFDTVNFDSSSAYSTSTGLWTCPVSGYYWVNTNISISSNNSDVFVAVNGAAFSTVTQSTSSNAEYTGTTLLQLNTNDTVAIWHDNGSGVNGGNAPQVSSFHITQDVSGSGIGTVTSVALTDATNIFNVTGSPITNAGTLSLASLKSQTANTFLAAPNGSSGAPTFRTIVAADVPTLNQNTTGTASNITGLLAIANGGTNNATLPVTAGGVIYTDGTKLQNVGAGTSGYVLTSNGASAPTWLPAAGGGGATTTQVTTNAAISAAGGANFIFNVVNYDTSSSYNTTTGVYTVPATGYLDIVGTSCFTNGGQTDIYLSQNGTIVQGRLLVSSGFAAGSFCTQLAVTVGDTIALVSDATAGGLAYSALTNTPTGYVPVITYSMRH